MSDDVVEDQSRDCQQRGGDQAIAVVVITGFDIVVAVKSSTRLGGCCDHLLVCSGV